MAERSARRPIVLRLSAVALALLAFDAACYVLLPARLARALDGYRTPARDDAPIGGRAAYPREYFVRHPARGFDLRPGATGTHTVDGTSYPIWVNSAGCFDREWGDVPSDYVYFAGDSSTWGYTPDDQRFASVFEARTGLPALKCGVTHTGQRHQLHKFAGVMRDVGAPPRHVIVGYSYNDVANDYAHPHTTVIEGWQVDTVFLDARDFGLVRVERAWIEERIARAVRAATPGSGAWAAIRRRLQQFSATAHVAAGLTRRLRGVPYRDAGTSRERLDYRGRPVRQFYALADRAVERGRLDYAETPVTSPNRAALLAWRDHAEAHGYGLTFLLVPYREIHDRGGAFFAELKAFMRAHGIAYIDGVGEFEALGAEAGTVYWASDNHLSPAGHALVAEILARRFGEPDALPAPPASP